MKLPTLATEFNRLRSKANRTLLEIALSCDLAETTIHKVGVGKPVRWETLHLILLIGLNLQPGSSQYESIHRLWMKQREEIAADNTKEKGTPKSTKHENAGIRAFREMIAGKDERSIKLMLAAARRRALSL